MNQNATHLGDYDGGDGIGVNIGFLSEPTPTNTSTWGRIKKRYR